MAKKKAKKKTKPKKRASVAAVAERRAKAAVSVCRHIGKAIDEIEDVLRDFKDIGVPAAHRKQAHAAKAGLERLLKNCVPR